MDQLDIEELLQPIAGENPCGEPLPYSFDPLMAEIKAARPKKDVDPLEPQEDLEGDWARIVELTVDALKNRSKHLYLAVHLTEALTNLRDLKSTLPTGFAGLEFGLRLIRELVDRYWDNLYPEIDEGDLSIRVAPLVWMTDAGTGARMPYQLRDVPLTPPDPDNELSFSWNFWNSRIAPPKGESEEESVFEARRSEAEKRGKLFEEAVASVGADYIVDLYNQLERARATLASAASLIDEKFGDLAPGWTALRNALDECHILVRRIANEKGAFTSPEATAVEESADETQMTSQNTNQPSGPVKSRAEALARLEEAARYLKETEPHSPVAYLVERAVSWGRMPFEQVMRELVRDASVMEQISDMLGIHRSGEE